MKYLDVGMVCSPERYIPQLTMDHLLIQKIPMRFFISNAIGTGAADARNFVQDMWSGCPQKSKYFLMTDNDLLIPEGALQDMIDYLDNNKDFGAISLHRTEVPKEVDEPKHINAGPVLFRSEVFEKIRYHNNSGCECQGMSNDVRDLGHRIGYLNNWLYNHIDRTKMMRKDPVEQEIEQVIDQEELSESYPEEQGLGYIVSEPVEIDVPIEEPEDGK